MTKTGPRVLIVDDDPMALKQLQQFLGRYGYCVLTAETGGSAIDAVMSQPIDFVLSDIRMPGMSVTEMIDSIRDVADIPIALMTAQPDAGQDLDPAAFKVGTILQKPLDLRVVRDLIAGAISSR